MWLLGVKQIASCNAAFLSSPPSFPLLSLFKDASRFPHTPTPASELHLYASLCELFPANESCVHLSGVAVILFLSSTTILITPLFLYKKNILRVDTIFRVETVRSVSTRVTVANGLALQTAVVNFHSDRVWHRESLYMLRQQAEVWRWIPPSSFWCWMICSDLQPLCVVSGTGFRMLCGWCVVFAVATVSMMHKHSYISSQLIRN